MAKQMEITKEAVVLDMMICIPFRLHGSSG